MQHRLHHLSIMYESISRLLLMTQYIEPMVSSAAKLTIGFLGHILDLNRALMFVDTKAENKCGGRLPRAYLVARLALSNQPVKARSPTHVQAFAAAFTLHKQPSLTLNRSHLSVMASKSHEYTPLTSETSFRLFRLAKSQSTPSATPDTFAIELFETSLENPPPYEAVSYAWGSNGLDCTVVCNGHQLRVAQTIVDFFQALSGTQSLRTLWIDAICIKQASVVEKNVKGPKMRTIYHKAKMVRAWLGIGSQETDIVFDHLLEVKSVWDICSDASRFSPVFSRNIATCVNRVGGTKVSTRMEV
jgi:hypothetical protein